MAESFDPYRKWLGIPPKDQPPNHYRLLGIDLFEADAEVIVRVAGIPKYRARLGSHNGRRAVTITGPIEDTPEAPPPDA